MTGTGVLIFVLTVLAAAIGAAITERKLIVDWLIKLLEPLVGDDRFYPERKQ